MKKRMFLGWLVAVVFVGLAIASPPYNYDYSPITQAPDLDQIELSIKSSDLAAVCSLRWDGDSCLLRTSFPTELTGDQQNALATIISTNSNWPGE